MTSTESQAVVYSSSIDIPYAVGSVAIPLSQAATSVEAVAASSSPGSSPAGTDGHRTLSTWVPTAHTAVNDEDDEGKRADASSARRRGVSSGNICSVRRCTHHRYCYIRDGGALERDAFYRWLMLRQQQTSEFGETVNSDKDDPQPAPSTSASVSVAPVEIPSLLYASLECVVFLLPSSFPHPRRVLRRPPFLIEDDTWAEHLVEVQLHFLSHLRIPPVTVVHQVLLEHRTRRSSNYLPTNDSITCTATAASPTEQNSSHKMEVREVCVPQLLASTFGKPKLAPVLTNVVIQHGLSVLPSNSTSTSVNCATENAATALSLIPQQQSHRSSVGGTTKTSTVASTTVVVAEKVDSLRLYHPTVPVLLHFRHLLALSSLPILHELQDAFAQLYPPASVEQDRESANGGCDNNNSVNTPFRYLWSLPYEEVVAEYAAQRASTSVAVLQTVLEGLKRERATMEETCQRLIEQITEMATKVIPKQLSDVHSHCLKMYRKE